MKKVWNYAFNKRVQHYLLIMKITVFFVLLGIFQVSASVYSQNTKLSVKLESVSINELLNYLEDNSEFSFLYRSDLFDDEKEVSIDLKSERLENILDQYLGTLGYSYEVDDRTVIIRKTEEKTIKVVQAGNRVTGKVTDVKGHPLPGVTITVLGTSRGVITGDDGSYSIEVEPTDKLVYSFIGMESQIIDVGNQTNIKIKLKDKSEELEDVTVVAFAKQKKESVIASISTVEPGELKVPSSNLTTALAGRVAGIISYQRSGEPGQDNAEFFIRGVTTFGYKVDPLILIDNVEVTTTELARMQPDDIASFSIMKDATATALYGARGANGVILVTTKSGVEGKVKISFRMENSVSMPTKDVELADPITYMQLHNEAVLTRDPLGVLPYSFNKIDKTIAGVNPIVYPITNWKEELFKDYAMNQRFNLNISGGGRIARYYVAGSINKDNGILKVNGQNNFNNNINLTKYTLRSNVNVNISKSTELIIRMNGNFDDYSGPIAGGTGLYQMVMRTNPALFPAYYPAKEGSHVNHIMFGNYGEGNYINPYAEMVKGYKDYSRSVMMAQLELKQDLSFITEGLNFRTLMNTNRYAYFDVNRSYNPYYYRINRYDSLTNEYDLLLLNEDTGTDYLGYSEGEKVNQSNFYLEAALSYNKTIAEKHGVSGLLVYTMRQLLEANAGSLQLSLPYRNMGVSGRATYSYDRRYFAEFNFGYNGSERFHKSNRFGFFPSVGLAWNVTNEPFFSSYKNVITNLKLRGTYGLVGNDAIGDASDRFYYLSNVNMNSTGATFGEEYGYSRTGIEVTRYANEDITWEISKKMNLALELGLFNKLQIQAEYFTEYRSNILMTRSSIPTTMGLSAGIRSNVGEASGRGIDLSVDYSHMIGNDIWLQGRGNFTYSTNKYEVYEEPEYNEWWRSREGYSIQQEWGYIAERLFVDEYDVSNSPQQFGEYLAGDIKYMDVNDDGRITESDMVPIGYPTIPEISYGFGLSAGYKNFDLSVFFQGVARESFRIGVANTSPFIDNDSNSAIISQNQLLKAYAEDHWSEDNRNIYALWPRLSTETVLNNRQLSTWFQRDGSFLRLKQLELGYSFSKFAKKNNMGNLRLYVNGTNLFCWSKFKLWDVEMAANGLGYPIQKVFNLGVHVSF